MVVILETAWDIIQHYPQPPENPSTENYPAAKFQVPETTQKHGNRDKELPFFPAASSSSSPTPRPGQPVLSHEDKLRMHIPVNQKGGDELSKSAKCG